MTAIKGLSARWTYPEREGEIRVGKLGRADVSGWARGTTRPHRPVCDEPVSHKAQLISAIRNVHPMEKVTEIHNPKDVVCVKASNPFADTDRLDDLKAEASRRRVRLSDCFARLYAGEVKLGQVRDY